MSKTEGIIAFIKKQVAAVVPSRKPWVKPERGSDADKAMVRAAIMKGECPDCGGKEFMEGPSGGICTNYECRCGSRFNIGAAFGSVMIADRIS